MQNKVAIVIPYFGLWPEWIDLYFYSCSRNPNIDFIFYTDCNKPKEVYENTKFIHINLSDYCSLISSQLGVEYAIANPYKLTDLKPFIGFIHQEDLKEYEFWGFGDLDLIYGDLSLVVNEKNLKRYNLITTHNYHIAGHFTLCRNNDYYRNLCFKIKEWETRLSENKHHAFDEGEWSDMVYPKIKWVRRIYNYIFKPLGVKFNSYMEATNRLATPNQLFSEFFTTPVPKQNDYFTYHIQSGRLCDYLNRELPYLHFLFFKKTPYYKTQQYWRVGFYQVDSNFEKYNLLRFDVNKIIGLL